MNDLLTPYGTCYGWTELKQTYESKVYQKVVEDFLEMKKKIKEISVSLAAKNACE